MVILKLALLLTRNGGESDKVRELREAVVFELEAYPEPKILTRCELKALMKKFGSTVRAAKLIGTSQAFVWVKLNNEE
jgi:hypothetical protein